MKLNLIIILTLLLISTSCKNVNSAKTVENTNDYEKSTEMEENMEVSTTDYPESISKVLKAHGNLDQWNKMKTLKFTMQKENGAEVTTTDLKNRKSLIDMPNHTIGFDGTKVWLNKKEDTNYEGNPKFYYNLMFYFYAMPFVLADDGIIYEDIKPLEFEGKNYPGIKISYESGVGESPEDEYILYYDESTDQMVWLGYTVTYFSKKKEKEFHFIKYSEWQDINGLLLPETLTWYGYKNNLPTEKQRDVKFMDVVLSEDKMNPEFFEKPEQAQVVE